MDLEHAIVIPAKRNDEHELRELISRDQIIVEGRRLEAVIALELGDRAFGGAAEPRRNLIDLIAESRCPGSPARPVQSIKEGMIVLYTALVILPTAVRIE